MTTPAPTRPNDFRNTLWRLLARLRGDLTRMSVVVLLAVTGIGMTTIVPALLGRATDTVVAGIRAHGVNVPAVSGILGLAAVCTAAAWLFQVLQGRLIATVVQRMAFQMREQADHKLSRLPLDYFDTRQRGEVLSRATNDIDNLAQTIQQVFARLLGSAMLFVGTLVMMLWISPLLTVVVLVTLPVMVWTATVVGKRSQPRFARQWAATGKLGGHIEEAFTGHELVTAFGRRDESARTFAEYNDELRRSSSGAQFVSGLIAPLLTFLGNINYILVAVIGGLRVASGTLSIGEIQAFVQYVMQLNQPVTTLASLTGLVQSAMASAERVFALLDADEQEPDPVAPRLPAVVTGRVEFTDVSFRYHPDQPLIDDLSLTVHPGQTVAVVGPTGAGKTTLVNLLLRFYETDGGTITVDGVDITDMSRDELRGNIGMVLQDTWLFGGTIAANIAYGKPDATRDQIVAAACAVHADRVIRTLPEGYDTVVDEDGAGLSAGERQLITIARAFLRKAPILVLDEATSSVDTRTEMLVQRAMATLRNGRTSFVIAHRLSTIRDADVILVMAEGRIVEQGTHEQLLAAEGAYARLWAAQLAPSAA